MSRPRNVIFEAVNDNGATKRVARIKCKYIYRVAWTFESGDGVLILPSDKLSLRNDEDGFDLVIVRDHGLSGSITFDQPIYFRDFYPNLYTQPNQFLTSGTKRVYGFFTVSS